MTGVVFRFGDNGGTSDLDGFLVASSAFVDPLNLPGREGGSDEELEPLKRGGGVVPLVVPAGRVELGRNFEISLPLEGKLVVLEACFACPS